MGEIAGDEVWYKEVRGTTVVIELFVATGKVTMGAGAPLDPESSRIAQEAVSRMLETCRSRILFFFLFVLLKSTLILTIREQSFEQKRQERGRDPQWYKWNQKNSTPWQW